MTLVLLADVTRMWVRCSACGACAEVCTSRPGGFAAAQAWLDAHRAPRLVKALVRLPSGLRVLWTPPPPDEAVTVDPGSPA